MSGKARGITLWTHDAKVILGMVARGDREHDIAAWFGVNSGRIPEVKAGDYGTLEAAPANQLPPSGAPGLKGRALYAAVNKAVDGLEATSDAEAKKAIELLKAAIAKFDTNEA